MIILYLKSNNQFLQAIMGFPKVKEENSKLLFANGKVIINDLTKAGWDYYEDKIIEPQYTEDEEGEVVEKPIYMKDLGLTPIAERPLSLKEEVDQLEGRVNEMKKDIEDLKRIK